MHIAGPKLDSQASALAGKGEDGMKTAFAEMAGI
jgi:hypothetical protein